MPVLGHHSALSIRAAPLLPAVAGDRRPLTNLPIQRCQESDIPKIMVYEKLRKKILNSSIQRDYKCKFVYVHKCIYAYKTSKI